LHFVNKIIFRYHYLSLCFSWLSSPGVILNLRTGNANGFIQNCVYSNAMLAFNLPKLL